MAKRTRPQRWKAAVAEAKLALSALRAERLKLIKALSPENFRPEKWQHALRTLRLANRQLKEAFDELRRLQTYYDEWRSVIEARGLALVRQWNKLEAIVALDLEPQYSNLRLVAKAIREAENVSLPLGYGRD